MSPRKLTDEDKQEILKLYRQTEETTSTLADRYGVSSSTISRFLKSHLSEAEYEDLIQQKRLARTPGKPIPLAASEEKAVEPVKTTPPRSEVAESFPPEDKAAPLQEWTISTPKAEEFFNSETVAPVGEVVALGEIIGEDLVGLDEDEDELEEEDYEDWEEEEVETAYTPSISPKVKIQVLPLSAAAFPKTCYLVIDRAAELITRPLKDFADLGKIPAEEFQQKTLPVFDNHRVARRFSNRSQRVIKVPDGHMLHKTSAYLQAKGITRLLMDGQIYSLSSS
ncbi:MAG: helix-turn-helix domain-containing protein [Hydrococcus sp. C42_A2020_068]|uniref:helix-turn-helix domain-containing protein n=1 Tax=Pleurocapsa sp. PCC 7327 TaxID=118163 RepID=UPI00029FCE5D|nr:helix-turn-helix domain-containing protein [Pleurocapsa sp. PCC 7327]AFY78194.1 Transposase [Pleurocapsa sp. PCC 7327]MBF2019993.1 helix-turn-helix domain-containing protein [Hydrococcus sp. C42_A2020_068]